MHLAYISETRGEISDKFITLSTKYKYVMSFAKINNILLLSTARRGCDILNKS